MRVPVATYALTIMIVLLCPTPGISGNSLKCQISPPANEICSPNILLESGDLMIGSEGFFELTAKYTACYHVEEVTIKGQLQRRSFPGGHSLELLATEIFHKQYQRSEKFPRTIGLITLKEALLQGKFIDTWAPLRTSGILQQTPTPREISCISADK